MKFRQKHLLLILLVLSAIITFQIFSNFTAPAQTTTTQYKGENEEDVHVASSRTPRDVGRKTSEDSHTHSSQSQAELSSPGSFSPLRQLLSGNRSEVPEVLPSDGALYNVSAKGFLTQGPQWRGQCWYSVKNFCVLEGELTFFHDPKSGGNQPRGGSLRMCNEFSRHSPTIQLKWKSIPLEQDGDAVLPAPLLTRTSGWVLQFWCMDLFHMTLSMMPAYHTMLLPAAQKFLHPPTSSSSSSFSFFTTAADEETANAKEKKDLTSPALQDKAASLIQSVDLWFRIARGKRKKGQYCRIKFGDPTTYSNVRNEIWGGDHQFPFPGNPYWPFYRLLSTEPWRLHPLYKGATKKSACYKTGVIDKLYIKDIMSSQARAYTAAQLVSLGINTSSIPARQCGHYRLTLIDRRGKTRRLTNIQNLLSIANQFPGLRPKDGESFLEYPAAASSKGEETQPTTKAINSTSKAFQFFAPAKSDSVFTAQSVALETMAIRDQIRVMAATDVLIGMHGNGLTWLQFLRPGSVVIELGHTWYRPYSKLWGLTHFHSSIKNNPQYKKQGEYVPFAHNETEVYQLLMKAHVALEKSTCGEVPPLREEKLDNLYKDCAPHC